MSANLLSWSDEFGEYFLDDDDDGDDDDSVDNGHTGDDCDAGLGESSETVPLRRRSTAVSIPSIAIDAASDGDLRDSSSLSRSGALSRSPRHATRLQHVRTERRVLRAPAVDADADEVFEPAERGAFDVCGTTRCCCSPMHRRHFVGLQQCV